MGSTTCVAVKLSPPGCYTSLGSWGDHQTYGAAQVLPFAGIAFFILRSRLWRVCNYLCTTGLEGGCYRPLIMLQTVPRGANYPHLIIGLDWG